MGNDIFWKGRQPDIKKQRECSFVLHNYFKEIDFFHKPYNEIILFPIISLDKQNHGKRYENINLCGVTSWNIPEEADSFSGIADRQFSFVFNNSAYLPELEKGRIITYESINNIKSARFQKLKEVLKTEMNDVTKIGAYSEFNHIRVLTSEDNFFIKVLFLVNTLFLTNMEVYDDYLVWQNINKWADESGFSTEIINRRNLYDKIQFSLYALFNHKIDESFVSKDLLDYWELSEDDFFNKLL